MSKNFEKAKIAASLEVLAIRERKGHAASAGDNIVKNFLAAAAEKVIEEVNKMDDKASIINSLLKALGVHHLALIAATGDLPAVDESTKTLFFSALIGVAKDMLQQQMQTLA
jgi:hypothetical protein